ncbi:MULTISPECIES: folate family ECF transporter S component [Terrabacteria group]|uniref:folate family ECF transporter S component n=1 Tax=Bacillati TaxID=1783272 RepID=UPI0019393629|nr:MULTISPECIES: folate family ECF transporter S component [Terrabacteria group]MBW9212247.1 folate family ECF transporter S component [Trueperella sp. zg.1013]QRG86210.1 folate family ECF transporter S component [Bulleidia sp. zg-1006]
MNLKERFSNSAKNLKDVRYLAIMAIFIALKIIATNYLHITVSHNLRAGFGFVLVAVEASILGPVAGMLSAAITDTLGFMLQPNGTYFPGYILTAMLGSFFYGIFLYGNQIKVRHLILAKMCNSIFTNIFLNSLWSSMLYTKKTLWGYMTASAIKNTSLFPLEVILLLLLFNALIPILNAKHLRTVKNDFPLRF